ncbi:MAG: DUF1190 domain-containing protein [Alphaproteobacteria bacterium]|nr:DUF1190 domain-containing protein [Alphaproteobacteria bacterium]MBT4085355.1 DUF1190 domain-containing protein [Alphaproteobacteria bacterium]MBT4544118.1 DUF1190 domain-containing protein [Alphaproteobacteria bacterium]MBT6385171.1 DUF1190 domain-containing protein [Alphaproteobacteria bacterium]MBT7744679.1 DUF1190 domain-containing protein [Alphaproteobacteria bacterium]
MRTNNELFEINALSNALSNALEELHMKRSKSLKLLMMGATAITLVACDEPQDVAVFENVEQCEKQEGFSSDFCETNFKTAQSEHIRVAPKYTSVADCEVDFGAEQCEIAPQRTSSGGSVFMPLMMGYMMGNMLSGGSRAASQPLYRSSGDAKNFRTGDNHKVGSKTGITKVSSQVARAPSTKTSTIRRGGFGKTAARTAGRFRSFGG